MEIIGTILFACGVFHTFLSKPIEHFAHRFKAGSIRRNVFHLLSEVEAVFALWSTVLIIIYALKEGFGPAVRFLESLNFTEPAFVFVIMTMAASRPIIILADKGITLLARLLPLPGKMSLYIISLIFGPLLGSLITEPAAMTVTATLLLSDFFTHSQMSERFKYATIGLLFVNVSIGGVLTNFAAPPVLMVAGKWGWGIYHMFTTFGLKAVLSIIISTLTYAVIFRKELQGSWKKVEKDDRLAYGTAKEKEAIPHAPWWVTLAHVLFPALVVFTAHHMVFFLAIFILFLAFGAITQKYQNPFKIRESLMVGIFLGGLVILGSLQGWWLQKALAMMGNLALYLGATALTAVTDNAALTYLGSLVPLSDSAKYYLVSGAVIGGGLTVIANAPNPAGYGILKDSFKDGISPLGLLLGALFPTLVPLVIFYFLGG